MNILIITPQFPYPPTGACEQDRLTGMLLFKELGHTVTVLSKVASQKKSTAEKGAQDMSLDDVHLVSYQVKKKILPRMLNPLFLDGAAYEYADPVFQAKLIELLDTRAFDVVWCEYTYLWPVYKEIRKRNIPIIVRSINVEPLHFLEEDGTTLVNRIKTEIKWMTEKKSVRDVAFVCAITPKEERVYDSLGVSGHVTLPLRALHTFIGTHTVSEKQVLDVVFMGSTYKVAHNYRAAEMIITEIAPKLRAQYGNAFRIHITGNKLPEKLAHNMPENVIYEGYVKDLSQFLRGMDIAIAPSLFGQGMQQKVFEPIVRGIPTIATERAIAEYDMTPGVEYVSANSSDEFVEALGKLQNKIHRVQLSEAAIQKSRKLFSKESMVELIESVLQRAVE